MEGWSWGNWTCSLRSWRCIASDPKGFFSWRSLSIYKTSWRRLEDVWFLATSSRSQEEVQMPQLSPSTLRWPWWRRTFADIPLGYSKPIRGCLSQCNWNKQRVSTAVCYMSIALFCRPVWQLTTACGRDAARPCGWLISTQRERSADLPNYLEVIQRMTWLLLWVTVWPLW